MTAALQFSAWVAVTVGIAVGTAALTIACVQAAHGAQLPTALASVVVLLAAALVAAGHRELVRTGALDLVEPSAR
jgi:hypothetical protein